MKKRYITIIGLILIIGLMISGCSTTISENQDIQTQQQTQEQIKQQETAQTDTEPITQDVSDSISDIGNIEQDLETSNIDSASDELENLDW